MISSRSPVRAQVLALLAVSLLAFPHVAAESTQGRLAARAPTPGRSRDRYQYSSFVAENDSACCPEGSTEMPCCAAGLTCVSSNNTAQATCVSIPAPTNSTGTNHTGNHTTETPTSTETDSGAMSVAAWGMWTSVVGLAAVVGVMSL
ncbi:hypothetical protein L211DRAFT_871643 [Terfezia boudieri ATCC MYA-4762]|uniref:Uncharacterized protein n=1 Tax=Terfezia boudieri ATCC MYA-4762 TaxID=1051890 RepID=A0A3N4L809_9PEZI|nr:hypothetical protein L211DRAFT_871643 [Terfezia boudieri ATCC MYA-4762]